MAPTDGSQRGCTQKNEDGQTKRRAGKNFDLQPDISYGDPKIPGDPKTPR